MSRKARAGIGLLLSLCVVLSLAPMGAVPVRAAGAACGSCGEVYGNGFCACGYEAPVLNARGYYEIANAGQLYWFSQRVNGGEADICARLTADITVNEGLLAALDNGDADPLPWIPIGCYNTSADRVKYTGTFDGGGHTVSGLYFSDPSASYVGLFGYVGSGARILDLSVADSCFLGGEYVGGMFGAMLASVSGCHSAARVEGSSYVGGLCGYSGGTVSGCSSEGTVTGGDYVGGIAGYQYNGTVTGCRNSGSVSGASCVGGILGESYGHNNADALIGTCVNEGTVWGNGNAVGGIVGMNTAYKDLATAKVRFCYNTGSVTGGSVRTGGIAGMNNQGSGSTARVEKCYNTGSVGGSQIVGYNLSGSVVGCFYLGSAAGGGVAGAYESRTADAFASGEVAYLLGSPFGQNLDNGGETQRFPVISDAAVYPASAYACSGESREDIPAVYSNFPDTVVVVHSYQSGRCVLCGTEDPEYTPCLRLAGDNRFETAFLAADRMKEELGVEKFDAVILASGTNFADALSGSYLACVRGAPILLCFNDAYNTKAVEYIKANLAPGGTVYILGGTAAVSGSVDAMLGGYTVRRLAGSNRFETNLLILKEAGVTAGQEILVCTGTNFADSLSASATARPILMVWNESGALTDSQRAYLGTLHGNSFCVIGGGNAVGAELESAVAAYGTTTRLAGANRFATSVLVAQKYFSRPGSVVLAYAWNYPDGLCGGVLACAMDAPLLLTMTGWETAAAVYVQGQGIGTGVILGGTGLISDEAAQIIFAAPEESPDTSVHGDYIGNINSRKFHLPDCGTLPNEQNRVYFETYEAAIAAGYLPCGNCLS